jgi:flavin-dependent dehydrogenase
MTTLNRSLDYDIIIAGGGPAGASAAIHLATRGARVLLAEQKKFPREKLCGEFISPECLPHFKMLGVEESMFEAQPCKLTETVFYSKSGRSVRVPSAWFRANGVALGLSRAEMDDRLLRRASQVGVDVLQNAQVTDLILDKNAVRGAIVKHGFLEKKVRAPITIDATGRTRALARRVDPRTRGFRSPRASLVAFKTHLTNTRVANGACEIYFYRGGYGGLSTIENGLSNLCFIASARDVRACEAQADRVMREVICQNVRARHALAEAQVHSPWLAVSLESFGRRSPQPADGLLAIGDAASFIDPFTGSGMLMALESGQLVAGVLSSYFNESDFATVRIGQQYGTLYERKFGARLRFCATLRRAAFVPGLASFAIALARLSDALRRQMTLATRLGSSPSQS